MNENDTKTVVQIQSKLSKNQFKCFRCREIFPQRDGDWFNWDGLQVHLCRTCDKQSEKDPKRTKNPNH